MLMVRSPGASHASPPRYKLLYTKKNRASQPQGPTYSQGSLFCYFIFTEFCLQSESHTVDVVVVLLCGCGVWVCIHHSLIVTNKKNLTL